MATETLDDPTEGPASAAKNAAPGLVVVYAGDRPRCIVLPLVDRKLDVGRRQLAALGIPDQRASARHVSVELDGHSFRVRDLGSRNGTFVEGAEAPDDADHASPLIRIGRTLMIAVGDYRPYESAGVSVREGMVIGPRLDVIHRRIEQIAQAGDSVLLSGKSGSGKELAAGAFHRAGAVQGPFVAVNCATLQRDLTERILFGARRGAYTGATEDSPGLVQSAHRGTLFLDEIAELDLAVQAKLLRVLETKKVTPIGALTPTTVDVRLCAATHKDLREEVLAGRFREDLYFRIGRPEVQLPSLGERREEIPWLIDHTLASSASAGAEFVEACMTRSWPGNIRELVAETKAALRSAATAGRSVLLACDLDERAGCPLDGAPEPPKAQRTPDQSEVETALRIENGNVLRAAARLGITRSRARRLIERHGIDIESLRSARIPR